MINFLEFKPAKCKDCYKCLKHCPVTAIEVIDHQAKIINSRCILCGTCTLVCPQNAKKVHNSIEEVKQLLATNDKVVASIAPSFVSSFDINNFEIMNQALIKLGFVGSEETAVGANAVTKEYKKMLLSGNYKNLITSACPAVDRMIQLYYPKALKYLAPVDSPMVAHAKIIKKRYPDAKIVFIGPCIAKKQEAAISGLIDGVLTFEELDLMLKEKDIKLDESLLLEHDKDGLEANRARFYPISRGIIKSFDGTVDGYEYLAIDGTEKCKEVLENIDDFSGIFFELNSCEHACVNGPCSLIKKGAAVKANQKVRTYVKRDIEASEHDQVVIPSDICFDHVYEHISPMDREPSEEEITAILAKTGKFTPEDELNCGACGYDTCRKKAWAVANGYADIEMCVPYMRKKAESLSYEIIQNMPNGIIVVDNEYKIKEINSNASSLLLVSPHEAKDMFIYDLMDSSLFIKAIEQKQSTYHKRITLDNSDTIVSMSVIALKEENSAFAVLKDITEKTKAEESFEKLRAETIDTTDEVIKKQMRVAQEIASVLGETVAETKVAILNLKKSLEKEKIGNKKDEDK